MSTKIEKVLAERVAELEDEDRRERRALRWAAGGLFLYLAVVLVIAGLTGHLRAPSSGPTVVVTTTVRAR